MRRMILAAPALVLLLVLGVVAGQPAGARPLGLSPCSIPGRDGCQLAPSDSPAPQTLPIPAWPTATSTPQPTPTVAGDLFNCSDFAYQEDAQRLLDADRGDPNHLDPDGNGVACDERPHKPTPTPTQVPRTPVPTQGSENGNGNDNTAAADSSTEGPVTAICNDGWQSHSQHRSGTCSDHGGVAQWINRPPS